MKLAFYVVGASDFQDMLPVIIESGKRNHQIEICVIDCLFAKRQLYYYDKEEVLNFIIETMKKNSVDSINVNFYGHKDQAVFEKRIFKFNPEYVFLQGLNHKFPVWVPTSANAKVINFAWHMDSAQSLVRGKYNVFLNVLKREDDARYYNENMPDWLCISKKEKIEINKVNSMYFGNFRIDHLKYNKNLHPAIKSKIPKDKKVCFILEAHLKKGKDNYEEVVKFTEELINYLKNKGFFVVWKKREKGYPKENWNSPLDFTDVKPNYIIEKDLSFPTSVVYLPYIADFCFIINTSSVYWDVKKVNKNTAMLQTKNPGPREEKYIRLVYSLGDPNAEFDLLDMKSNNRFEVLSEWLGRKKNINNEYIEKNNGSKNLLSYLESNE